MRFNPFASMLRDHAGVRRVVGAGLAAIVLLAGSIRPATANDLSTSPCTAGDVEIVGSGIVINEPCTCTGGTFTARVQFTVRNNTSTGRYCIALHLVPEGVYTSTPIDVVLRDATGSSTAPGKSGSEKFHDTVMYGDLPNFACSMGMLCFGQAAVVKGKCSPGQCTTISWNTSPGAGNCTVADENPPGGQCRHQQVCVVGYGATLACITNCNPGCGGTTTLQACITAPTSRGPFSVTVAGNDGSTQTQSTFGDASGTFCLNFNVTPTRSPVTVYTLTVTDREGCTRTATTSINVTPVVASITPGTAGCRGIQPFTASVSGSTGCTFTWTIDGQSLTTFRAGGNADDARVARLSGTGNATLEFRALDGVCHTVAVSSSCPSTTGTPCVGSASTAARQCVGNSTCP